MVRHLDRPQQNDRVEVNAGCRVRNGILYSTLFSLLLALWIISGCQKGVGTIYSIAIHPTRPEVIYLSSEKGLYKTVDGGTLWNRIEGGLGTFPVLSIAISPALPSILYIGTGSGLFKTEDGGKGWTRFESLQ